MSDSEDPNKDANQDSSGVPDPRERSREVHRAQLEAVRSAFSPEGEAPPPGAEDPEEAYSTAYLIARLSAKMRGLERRQRNTARLAAALVGILVVSALAFVQFALPELAGPTVSDEISARSIRADRVAVTGDLRLLDPAGNVLAVLGRDSAEAGSGSTEGPVVFALKADGDPSRQVLRLAASKTGAGLTLQAPTGSSSVSLLSMQTGSTVEVRNGGQTERLAGDSASELAPVAAGPGPKTPGATPRAAGDVPVWTPRDGGPPRGDLPEVREIGHGFLVADLSAEPTAEGVEVRGRMVNTTAVVHNGLAFRIALGGVTSTLTVPKISPGNSTGFRVTLPGAAVDQLRDARVEYLGSTVAFQASSVEPVYGRQVEAK